MLEMPKFNISSETGVSHANDTGGLQFRSSTILSEMRTQFLRNTSHGCSQQMLSSSQLEPRRSLNRKSSEKEQKRSSESDGRPRLIPWIPSFVQVSIPIDSWPTTIRKTSSAETERITGCQLISTVEDQSMHVCTSSMLVLSPKLLQTSAM